LALAGEDRLARLTALRADQARRWQEGDRVPVEHYCDRFPDLLGEPEILLDLLSSEALLRMSQGETLCADAYVARFPAHESAIRRQFALHGAVQDSSNALTLSGPGGTQVESPGSSAGREDGLEPTLFGPTPVLPAPPPVTVPGYEILGELGRGGMGVVYQARQTRLNRLVALKMILSGAHASPQHVARMRAEAEALARLAHPNIVQIYDVGEQDGRPFLALEYADGGSLERRLQRQPQPPRQSAELIETLARASHAAHQRGVIHRDLKPANVLLTADGTPKITDFGLAKQLGTGTALTATGMVMGTPSYMAPEQASGKPREIGPAADVYSLGAILYEMLTGRPPFQAATALELLDAVRTQDPVSPTDFQPRLPRDLVTICLRCLAKQPARRYPSALALADDLRAFLAGDPIQARPAGRGEQVLRWGQRHPVQAIVLGAAVVASAVLLAGLLWQGALVVVGALAVLALAAGAWWHNVRLQSTLRELAREHAQSERHVERLHLLLEMTRRIVSATDLDALLRLIAETATRLSNAERATIYLVDEERHELWSRVTVEGNVGTIRVPVGVGIAGTVAASGEIINIPDAYADPRFNPEVDRRSGYRTQSLLTFPLTAQDGRVFGVLQVLNKRDGPFGAGDTEALAALAASAAIAIQNAPRQAAESAPGPAPGGP
jgi:serine/threonine-protein kinase